MTTASQVQRAAQVILSGKLSVLQRRALADLLLTVVEIRPPEPFDAPLKIIIGSVLDALAPTPHQP